MNYKYLLEQLINKHDLSSEQMQDVIQECMSGAMSDVQIAAFLALMRAKGETSIELSAAAHTMRHLARAIPLGAGLVDIVGTGGDGKNTFNVSTASSFVIAAAGIKVAKHGNRSVSSSSGSADLLEAAGFCLTLTDAQITRCLDAFNLAFLFAPHYHPAMQYTRTARQQLGIRTLFNLLGPLINPAQVKKQVVGVFSSHWLKPLAEVLISLDSERFLVVSSQDGLDEISIAAPTEIIEYQQGALKKWLLDPHDYGMFYSSLDDIIIDSPQQSLALIHSVLNGTAHAARDMVLLNSAAAIYCARDDYSFLQALKMAVHVLDTGRAKNLFNQLQQFTQQLAQEAYND